ncbi:MAG: hypothetical protein KIT57_13910 [Blastocatellales bacterium]|nr:hypothetical protein [Blastocatellales bacterium]
MKRIKQVAYSALAFSAIIALSSASSGCGYAKMVLGKDKLNQGVLLYNQGRNREAREHFKDATDYMPDKAVAWLYYGAAMSKDYKGLGGEQRESGAKETLAVFQKALELSEGDCKLKDSATAYIASIYDDLGQEDLWREWTVKRAEDECSSKELKATTFHAIAVKFWQCAYDQTTRYADKAQMATDAFHYRNMDYEAARADKVRVEECITRGMEFVERALAVDPEYADVMFYKGLLYREKQKMTKVDADRKKYEAEAKRIADEASALVKKKQEAAAAQPTPQGS